ncbi:choline-glycine betaine transporter [Paraburkholderia sp. 32]
MPLCLSPAGLRARSLATEYLHHRKSIFDFDLLVIVILTEPTTLLVRVLGENAGNYSPNLVTLSMRSYAYESLRADDGLNDRTILY